MDDQRPKVGIGIMILKNGKVLMSKRKVSHGTGEYQFPGGHLELNESFEECGRREIKEEAGVKVKEIKFLFLANIIQYGKHYVHIGLITDWKSGVPKDLEPEKSTEWQWYDFDSLPYPLFLMAKLSFDAYKTGKTYYDS